MEQFVAGGATCLITLVVAVLVMVVLGMRDASRNRKYQESRPVEDRIREIATGSAFMIEQFQRVAQRPAPHGNLVWLPATIEYHRRLESLASSPATTPEDALDLAAEALQFEREHRLKGINVSRQANTLATLLQRRDLPPEAQ